MRNKHVHKNRDIIEKENEGMIYGKFNISKRMKE